MYMHSLSLELQNSCQFTKLNFVCACQRQHAVCVWGVMGSGWVFLGGGRETLRFGMKSK